MFNIALRDLRALFTSPIGYVVSAIFSLIAAYFFINIVALYTILSLQALRMPWLADRINLQELVIRPFFGNVGIILLFVIPMVTMRAFAEEKKSGTFELIYTSPLTTVEMVIGKFLGLSGIVFFLLFISLLFVIPLLKFGEPDKGVILTSYFGLVLMALAFVSAGIFASSITENQIISVIVSFGILLLFWVLGWVRGTLEGNLKEVLSYLSFMEHYQNFTRGIIDSKDIIYYFSFVAFFLWATIMWLDSRRYRGKAG